MIYYFILLFLYISGVLELFGNKQVKIALVSIAYLFFIILAGLKYNVGTDYPQYKYLYHVASVYNYSVLFGVELLYWWWMRLFIIAGAGFLLFWFITSLINIFIKFKVINTLSPYFFPAMLMYFIGLFFERDFDGIRQGISIGICYLGITHLVKSRYLVYYALVILACFFHSTSMVFLLLPLLQKINLSLKWVIAIAIAGILLVILQVDITESVIAMLPDSTMKGKVNTYLAAQDELYVKSTGISIGIIFRLVILVLFTYFGARYYRDNPLYNILKNGFLFAIILSLIFNSVDLIAHRLGYGLRELQIFIVPSFMLITDNKWKKLGILSFIFLYSFFLLYRLLNTEHLKIYYQYDNVITNLLQ